MFGAVFGVGELRHGACVRLCSGLCSVVFRFVFGVFRLCLLVFSLCLVVFGAGQLCLAGTQAIRWVSKHSRLRVCLVVFSSCLVVFSLCLLVFGVCLVVCSGTWACDCVAKSVFSVFVCVQTQHCSTLNCVCLCLELCLAVFATVFGSAQIRV